MSYSKRIILNGMLSNSNGSYSIQVKGINPSEEIKVTNTYEKIIEGEYFEDLDCFYKEHNIDNQLFNFEENIFKYISTIISIRI